MKKTLLTLALAASSLTASGQQRNKNIQETKSNLYTFLQASEGYKQQYPSVDLHLERLGTNNEKLDRFHYLKEDAVHMKNQLFDIFCYTTNTGEIKITDAHKITSSHEDIDAIIKPGGIQVAGITATTPLTSNK